MVVMKDADRRILRGGRDQQAVYYSLLEELSTAKKSLGALGSALSRKTTDLQGYPDVLREMRIARRVAPVTAREDERSHRDERIPPEETPRPAAKRVCDRLVTC